MKNLGLKKFVGFIRHYGDEAALLASSLRALAHPFLERSEREALDNVINRFENVATNIAASLPELEKVSAIRIDKSDVKDALEEMVPDLIGRVVAELAKQNAEKSN